jgi:anaerobic selenocysteine-containing dehydrogenase
VGGPPLAHTNALFTALAVNALNAVVGSVGQPGGLFFTPQFGRPQAAGGRAAAAPAAPRLNAFVSNILGAASSPIKVLLVDGANPVFAAPRAWKVREALEKIPFIASFGSFIDETSLLADLVLPDHSFLESWTEAIPESGSLVAVASVAGPAMKPLFQTRATPDVLLEVGRTLKRPLDLGWQTFDEMVKASFDALGEDVWTKAQQQGGWWGELPRSAAAASPAAPGGRAIAFAEPQFDGDASQYPFHFLPYASQSFLDGSVAHLPWLQELPDPMTSAMWSSWVELNPKTAEELGIRQGDLVEITSSIGALRAPAFVSPALAPNVIAMPVGQGHQTFTRIASGRGVNPIEILAPVTEPETGALAWAATRVKIARVGGADGRLILFAGETREQPHAGETR